MVIEDAVRVADDLYTLTLGHEVADAQRAQIMEMWRNAAGESRRLIVLSRGARLEYVGPGVACLLHHVASDLPDSERSFPRVPCLGEDVVVEGSPDVWRVVGVVWAVDKPLIELSRVVR